jgi:hypothetical protein
MTTQLIYYPELIRAVSKAVKNETPLSISDLETQKNWLSLALPAIKAQKYVSISPQYDVPYRDFQIVFDLVLNTKYIYDIHFRVSFRGYHPYLLSEYSDTPISSLASVEHLIAVIKAIAKHAETYLKNGQQVEAEEVKKEKISSLKCGQLPKNWVCLTPLCMGQKRPKCGLKSPKNQPFKSFSTGQQSKKTHPAILSKTWSKWSNKRNFGQKKTTVLARPSKLKLKV